MQKINNSMLKMISACPTNAANEFLIDFSAEMIKEYLSSPGSFHDSSTVPIARPWNSLETTEDDLMSDLLRAIEAGDASEILVFAARVAARKKIFA